MSADRVIRTRRHPIPPVRIVRSRGVYIKVVDLYGNVQFQYLHPDDEQIGFTSMVTLPNGYTIAVVTT